MKQTTYHFGDFTFKAYMKTAGRGWEVGVTFEKKTVFIGNFVHKSEALKWWGAMGTEIRHFTRTYRVTNKAAKTWYGTFFSNHLYKTYYKFLDKLFVKHTTTYNHALTRDMRRYKTLKRQSARAETRFSYNKAA